MTTPTVNIPLPEYIELKLRGRDYCIIDADAAQRITTTPGHEAYCVVENRYWTLGWLGKELPQLDNGLFRLWNKQDWINCDNRHREIDAKIKAREAVERANVEAVVRYFTSQGIADTIAREVVKGMSLDAIAATAATLPTATTTK